MVFIFRSSYAQLSVKDYRILRYTNHLVNPSCEGYGVSLFHPGNFFFFFGGAYVIYSDGSCLIFSI